MIKIKKGLSLPINGLPAQKIENARPVSNVAIVGPDYVGMKPTMLVKEGDKVKVGQKIFECKKVPGVFYTAPASGTVTAVQRGERRVLQNVVIEVEGSDYQSFDSYTGKATDELSSDEVRSLLIESGMWPTLRTRPFSKAPAVDSTPAAIFINCMDTNPCAVHPEVVIEEHADDFVNGVNLLAKLTEGKTFITKAEKVKLPAVDGENIVTEEFGGPHPAGNVGTHIHFLCPVGPKKTVWHVGYQDVIAIGSLFKTGRLFVERVVALGGPMMKNPRLLRTRVGACMNQLLEGEIKNGGHRVISGSVFNGRKLDSDFCYLGRFHTQISTLTDTDEREFLGWQGPGFDKFSIKNCYAGKFKVPSFDFSTKLYGSHRAMVPVGIYEEVMPLDILPTQLLRALVTNDTDLAQQLGALELDEEDLALCTFASPGKVDFGPSLRENLTTIEKEG
ncbi:MAG: Na(+)-translocating NADH-quinone reductase subunit A [Oligoflexia bacterium]|nr:Na(+)-translocating NADH-quinone reductase subunit A [Oligoflexia bacterium]